MTSESRYIPAELPTTYDSVKSTKPNGPSIEQIVFARKEDYTSTKIARIKIGTWNVGSCASTETELGKWFVGSQTVADGIERLSLDSRDSVNCISEAKGDDTSCQKSEINETNHTGKTRSACDVDLYVLGLQEIVDLNSAIETLRPYSDVSASKKFKSRLEAHLPLGYQLVAEQQLVGLLLLIYAGPEIMPQLQFVSTTNVGTGLMGYMGNKGAVAARLLVGETTGMVFVNCHLSSGVGKTELQRRNWDAAQIADRIQFQPITDGSGVPRARLERLGDEDYAFLFGDLNYRIESNIALDVRRILTLHSNGKYALEAKNSSKSHDISSEGAGSSESAASVLKSSDHYNEVLFGLDPSHLQETTGNNEEDPTSLRTTLNSLLPHDELLQQQNLGLALQDGWKEAEITFLPTYKYDIGSANVFDSGDKKRSPSWCDRILYRVKQDHLAYLENVRVEQQAKRKDDQIKAQGIEWAAEDENTMLEYDPETDGDEYFDDRQPSTDHWDASTAGVTSDNGTIQVESYCSHQDVVSSDHKPVDCIFNLGYDAINFALKSEVYNKIARQIDRAENEGLPTVTIVVEEDPQDGAMAPDCINLGPVAYDDPKTRTVTIANTGQVPSQFSFTDSMLASPITTSEVRSLKWLSIYPPSQNSEINIGSSEDSNKKSTQNSADLMYKLITLNPGESMGVELVAHVKDKELVKILNKGAKLESILILHVNGGKDLFFTITASWRSSIHARTITSMVRIPEGGCALDVYSSEDSAVLWSAPREIFRLTEVIETLVERLTAEWDILGLSGGSDLLHFLKDPGWPFKTESWTLNCEARRHLRRDVNEALDLDQSFDSILSTRIPALHRLEIFCESLIDLLENLEDGVLPTWLWDKIETEFFEGSSKSKLSSEEKRSTILERLASSPSHSISFVLLTTMLARVSQDISRIRTSELQESPKAKTKRKAADNSSDAKMSLVRKNFAAIFANVLVRSENPANKITATSERHKLELLLIFLSNSV